MQITDNVYQVGGSGLTTDADAAVYLIRGNGAAALVDAGCGIATDRMIDNIRETGIRPQTVRWLLLTHCHFDHTGGANELRKRLGCRVAAHELDAGYIEQGDDRVTAATWYGRSMTPFPVDLKFIGRSNTVRIDDQTAVSAVHMPGHSPGSVVYLLEAGNQTVLFAQDVHGPLDVSFHSDRQDYQASLKRMRDLDADILCEGHFGVYTGKDAVRDFISSFILPEATL